MRRKSLVIMVIAIGLLFSTIVPATVVAREKIHVYPGDSIQAALDAANEGDTIIVHSGTYYECIAINTNNLTLISDGAVLDASGFGVDIRFGVITINNGISGVTIKGFEIWGYSRTAIRVNDDAYNNVIKNNNIYNSRAGISIFLRTHHNEIINNEVSVTWLSGIFIVGSGDNIVKDNDLNYGRTGIWLRDAQNNEIKNNVISNAVQTGVLLNWDSTQNNLVNDNVILYSGMNGIELFPETAGNIIRDNTVSGSGGFDLFDGDFPGPIDNLWVNNIYTLANW